MMKTLLVVYGMGVLFTSAALLRPQAHRHAAVLNGLSILLWPFYWTYFLSLVFLQRDRS